jgi:hypothetical protein
MREQPPRGTRAQEVEEIVTSWRDDVFDGLPPAAYPGSWARLTPAARRSGQVAPPRSWFLFGIGRRLVSLVRRPMNHPMPPREFSSTALSALSIAAKHRFASQPAFPSARTGSYY